MSEALTYLMVATGGGVILWLVAKAIIAEYFSGKRKFVDELVEKQKGANDGQRK